MRTSFGQHLPSIIGLHNFSAGEHWMYVDTAANPKARLTDIMMNQMNFFIQPSDMRNTVIANEVLLHVAARMEKNPLVLDNRRNVVRSLGLKSHMCLPYPIVVLYDIKTVCTARATYIILAK